MINKLLNIFSKNKKSIFFILFFVFAFFAFSDISFANESWNLLDTETKEKIWEAIRWIWSTIVVFLSILTYLWVMFLSPEWINGSLFGLNEYFKDIWILVSNVVYFIFAFILIWIAFMNIIWKWQDKYQLKQALPKFLIWILIVPLSWFIVNFILSISAILTVAAINLPFDTFQWFNSKISEVDIPNDCKIDLTKESWNKDANWNTPTKKYFSCVDEKDWWKTVKLKDIMNSDNSSTKIFWVLWTYAYGVLWLESLDYLTDFQTNTIKTIWDLIVKLVFDVLFIVVYAVLMIALALVLMTRWIYIWIYLMISPVFGLMYFFDKSSWGWEFFDKFNIKQFISLAMVPVYTMLALTFGLLFIFVVWQWMVSGNTSNSFPWLQSVSIKSNNDNESSTLTIGSWQDDDKKFKLTIVWAAASEKNITEIWDRVKTEWNWWLGVIWTLIMKIFGIVILWWAVMAALRSNDVTKAVVEPLHAFGTQVWQLAAKSPQYMPLFWGQSMQSLKTIQWSIEWSINQWARDRATNFTSKYMPFLDADSTWRKANMETLHNNLKTWNYSSADTPRTLKPAWIEYLKNIQDTEWARRLDTEDVLKEFARKLQVDISWINFNSRAWYADAIKRIENRFDWDSVGWVLDWDVSSNASLWPDDIDRLIRWVSSNWWNNQQNNWWNNQQNNWWNNQQSNQQDNVASQTRTVNINLTDNWMRQIDLSWVEWISITDEDITAINSINDVNWMTKVGFSNKLRDVGISNNKIDPIINYLVEKWITFSDNNN